MTKLNSIKKLNILAVSHDAGGAHVLSSFIKKKKLKCHYLLSGPAVKIFKSKIKILKRNKNFSNKNYSLLMTGTSYKNNTEVKYLKKAKKKNIYSLSFLDSWANYKERFKYLDKYYYPNEIVVGDKKSLKIAKKVFKKKTLITKIDNPYLASFKIKKVKKNNDLIYLSSNFDGVKKFKFSDKFLFMNFLKKVDKFVKNKKIHRIVVKNHPGEKSNKYNFIKNLKMKDLKLEKVTKNYKLEDVLKNTKFVAGYDTTGLVVGKLLKNFVINLKFKGYKSSIPEKYIDMYL